jgi:hypothetical protein
MEYLHHHSTSPSLVGHHSSISVRFQEELRYDMPGTSIVGTWADGFDMF